MRARQSSLRGDPDPWWFTLPALVMGGLAAAMAVVLVVATAALVVTELLRNRAVDRCEQEYEPDPPPPGMCSEVGP